MNHCPVYTRIGGHAYSTTYPGPIGKILTPQMKGLHKAGYLADASSLCGACVEVCPVKNFPKQKYCFVCDTRKKRTKAIFHSQALKLWENRSRDLVWKGWKTVFSNPGMYRLNSLGIARLGNFTPRWMPVFRNWTSVRSPPVFAKKNLHQLAREEGLSYE
ncbi:MAG: hypothetical protein CM1200mP28_16490 [Deltaproteobacteria bacterium]|nr:MAG: hypothetical protein CM1200mP28_16490 [Deltaproteobacteria bacterium]